MRVTEHAERVQTFQVRAMFTQTTPKTYGQIWFSYAAYGAPAAPPPTTTATSTPTPTTSASGS